MRRQSEAVQLGEGKFHGNTEDLEPGQDRERQGSGDLRTRRRKRGREHEREDRNEQDRDPRRHAPIAAGDAGSPHRERIGNP